MLGTYGQTVAISSKSCSWDTVVAGDRGAMDGEIDSDREVLTAERFTVYTTPDDDYFQPQFFNREYPSVPGEVPCAGVCSKDNCVFRYLYRWCPSKTHDSA